MAPAPIARARSRPGAALPRMLPSRPISLQARPACRASPNGSAGAPRSAGCRVSLVTPTATGFAGIVHCHHAVLDKKAQIELIKAPTAPTRLCSTHAAAWPARSASRPAKYARWRTIAEHGLLPEMPRRPPKPSSSPWLQLPRADRAAKRAPDHASAPARARPCFSVERAVGAVQVRDRLDEIVAALGLHKAAPVLSSHGGAGEEPIHEFRRDHVGDDGHERRRANPIFARSRPGRRAARPPRRPRAGRSRPLASADAPGASAPSRTAACSSLAVRGWNDDRRAVVLELGAQRSVKPRIACLARNRPIADEFRDRPAQKPMLMIWPCACSRISLSAAVEP